MTDNRPTIVIIIAVIILLLQSVFAGVSLVARVEVAQARTALDEPAITCQQLEAYPPLQAAYEGRPLQSAVLDGAFLWVLLMIPFNVAGFMVIAPQLQPVWLRRGYVIGMALSLLIIFLNLNAIGLTRCALA